jgi:ABC-type sugar transport system ATPase subunit
MKKNIFEIRALNKKYPGVQALKNVNLDIKRDTVHCIVGENGAGKSTLIKILTCAEERTEGEIFYNRKPYSPRSIRDAMHLGISTLFQELNVVDQLTVEENLVLGRERSKFGIMLKSDKTEKVLTIFREIAPDISLRTRVSKLSFAQKQVIEIVKAVGFDASLIIMDEPTAALSEHEVQRLFKLIKNLKEQHITIIYISHILNDIFEIGDFVTVFRDGMIIDTARVSDITTDELINMMVGKVVVDKYVDRVIDHSQKVLEVNNLTTGKLRDISFELYKGEIIGFYGLLGAGKSEIAQVLYGLDPILTGRIKAYGKIVHFNIPKDSMKNGITMVPEERLTEGLIMKLSIRSNIVITNLKKIARFSVVNAKKERSIAERYIKKMNIRANNAEQIVATLSGGNQQKVVISKCLNAESVILLMDEPTRGIDVGAKQEIHRIIRELAESGVSIMIFSSEYPEIVNLCDRIFLLREGSIVKVLDNNDARIEEIMDIITKSKGEKYADKI